MKKENEKNKKVVKTTNTINISIKLAIIVLFVISLITAGISAYAATTLINSREVKYDNSTSGINATNVQDAIVELNNNATDYSTIISRLNALEGKIYPVGSIYISVNNTNPGTFLGGTWVAFGQGRTWIGVNASDGDYNAAEKTGGSKTKTLAAANIPAHTHSIPALSGSAASAGGHTHTFSGTTSSAGSHSHSISKAIVMVNNTGAFIINDSNFDGIVASDNLPSSYGVWTTDSQKNGIIASGGAHTHTYSGTTSNNGAHTHTVSTNASTSGSSGSGTAFSTMDPYITVYMWKRTA